MLRLHRARSTGFAARGATALCSLVAALALAACGSDDSGDTDPPATTATADEAPISCPSHRQDAFDAQQVVGESVQGAERLAERHGCSVRVIERDGEPLAGTDDLVPSRINVVVENGLVTQVAGVG
jgi:hypothetical protein